MSILRTIHHKHVSCTSLESTTILRSIIDVIGRACVIDEREEKQVIGFTSSNDGISTPMIKKLEVASVLVETIVAIRSNSQDCV